MSWHSRRFEHLGRLELHPGTFSHSQNIVAHPAASLTSELCCSPGAVSLTQSTLAHLGAHQEHFRPHRNIVAFRENVHCTCMGQPNNRWPVVWFNQTVCYRSGRMRVVCFNQTAVGQLCGSTGQSNVQEECALSGSTRQRLVSRLFRQLNASFLNDHGIML